MPGSAKDKYLGKSFVSKYGEAYKVIEYRSSEEVVIQYTNGCTVTTNNAFIRSGNVPNPFRPIVCNVGYHGVGEYKLSIDGKKTDTYLKWHGILSRTNFTPKSLAYAKAINCYKATQCDPVWFNYQVFSKWMTENSPTPHPTEAMCIDSDLLGYKENMYSPKTCCMLPYGLNIAIQIGNGYYFCKTRCQWHSRITFTENGRYKSKGGRHDTEKAAKMEYCKLKDAYIKGLAEKYKEYISEQAYLALCNFNTEDRQLYQKGYNLEAHN